MPHCVMRFCTNYTSKISKSQGITYHLFPSDDLRRIEWVNIVRQQRKEDDWLPSNHSKICSNHFKNEDKQISKKGYTQLKKGALPVIKDQGRLSPRQTSPGSPNSLEEEDDEDLESIFDTPEKSALKLRIQKLTIDKQKLINKNKNLNKRNKRLIKKVEHMSNILKILKKKKIISDEQLTELNIKF